MRRTVSTGGGSQGSGSQSRSMSVATIQEETETGEALIQKTYGNWSRAIFDVADVNRNGSLSINEMTSMLSGTAHQGFVDWLLFHRNEMFKLEDKDNSGTLEVPELARALRHFHRHVKAGESQPLLGETDPMLVCRHILEHMYKTTEKGEHPSFGACFDQVDLSKDGVLSFNEIECMIRRELHIPTRKVSLEHLRNFFGEIDRNGGGTIERAEFMKFMAANTLKVGKCFVSFPPPPKGMTSWADTLIPEHENVGAGFDFGQGRAPWMVQKTPSEMVAHCRSYRKIAGYTSFERGGTTLPPRPDLLALPKEPPLPDIDTALRNQIQRDVAMKERRENTSWDLNGPRYQLTSKMLESYHFARQFGAADGFYVPTKYGGTRLKHVPPIMYKGKPLSYDEAEFAEQRGRTMQEPLWLATLPAETGVYDRLCNVTTTSRLLSKVAYADERARSAPTAAQKPRKGHVRL
eukprot:CAMPEP_0171686102 /NCGR_PEP_ID=MMETSP0991-20121206/2610_1 /TAXON_ID=483369 /ORGANISM="non described non described, Strain CCMP2098" /LENGTH=462 /DNA_ID=CAMNT_0012273809 /DNA_START=102 /DNA_END=1490 /DNA_ORIENTATION=+